MKKIISIGMVCSLLASGVALASPLTDYSAGKTAIDLTWRNVQDEGSLLGVNAALDRKYNLDLGVTVGLGGKFAFQYNQLNPKAEVTSIAAPPLSGDRLRAKIWTQQYNVLYKISENVSAYTGVFKTHSHFSDIDLPMIGAKTRERNIWQVGVSGSTKLAPKTTLYGSIGLGKNLTDFTAGVSYEFAPNTELSLSYRDFKVDHNVSLHNNIIDYEANGLGLGVTHKF